MNVFAQHSYINVSNNNFSTVDKTENIGSEKDNKVETDIEKELYSKIFSVVSNTESLDYALDYAQALNQLQWIYFKKALLTQVIGDGAGIAIKTAIGLPPIQVKDMLVNYIGGFTDDVAALIASIHIIQKMQELSLQAENLIQQYNSNPNKETLLNLLKIKKEYAGYVVINEFLASKACNYFDMSTIEQVLETEKEIFAAFGKNLVSGFVSDFMSNSKEVAENYKEFFSVIDILDLVSTDTVIQVQTNPTLALQTHPVIAQAIANDERVKNYTNMIEDIEKKDKFFNFLPLYEIKNFDMNFSRRLDFGTDTDTDCGGPCEGSSCAYYLKYDELIANNNLLFIAQDYPYKGKEINEYLEANHSGNQIFLKLKKSDINERVYENENYFFKIMSKNGIGIAKFQITSKKSNKHKILYLFESCAG